MDSISARFDSGECSKEVMVPEAGRGGEHFDRVRLAYGV